MKLPFDYDPATTMKRVLHVDNVDPRRVAMETTQNKKPFYELAKAVRSAELKPGMKDWGRYVGEIPYEDYMNLCKEYPELRAKGPGAREARQKAIQKIFMTHPDRFKWLYHDRF